MSWDEALFSAAWDGAKRLLQPKALPEQVDATPHRERLEVLARLLSGAPLTITLTDELGGIRGDVIFLPRRVDWGPTPGVNESALLLRVAWACATRALRLQLKPGLDPLLATAIAAPLIRSRVLDDAPTLSAPLQRLERAERERRPAPPPDDARAQALEATVRLALRGTPDKTLPRAAWAWAAYALSGGPTTLPEVPRLFFRRAARVPPVLLWGELMPPPPALPAAKVTSQDEKALSSGTERQKKAVSRIERVQEPQQQLQENPLVHSFEKVHTLEAYKGGSKRIDGDDELSAHQKALDELDLRQVVRSHQRARSVYRADVLLDAAVGDVEDAPAEPVEAVYDEWDEAEHRWRKGWCRLTTRQVPIAGEASEQLRTMRGRLAKTTTGLRAVFEQLEASRAWRLRQKSGTDVDVDAVVSRYGALRAGHCSEDRLYATRRRHTRDTAVLVLLDASLSTDAWVANRRVLDVEKEAVVALGDALDGLFDEVAVAAFCSQSRRDCRFLVAKGFKEDWASGAQRVASLEPAGFTRIGPAVRHATAELLKCGARQKLLLLVSDGKPSDVDRYEGRYGVADIHRAVLDAQAAGVVTHALAVDPAAKGWLPSMFGHGRASVVQRPEELVTALATVTGTALRR